MDDGFAVAIHDISERARAENLRARLAAIVESSEDAIFSVGLDGRIETWNAGAERLFGWSREEIVGQPAALLEIQPRPARAEAVRRRKDGSSVDVALVVSAIPDASGAITGHAVIARDVSAQRRAEQKVQASLREKEVLLTEVHHRVKNNLQVICSLLSLQAAKVRDARALEMFQESQDRVRSIAAFHEHLYQSQDLARIDIGAYVRTLVGALVTTYGRAHVRVEVDADDVRLGVDKAIPVGLLCNELVSNALKHAFPDGRGGTVRVTLRSRSRGDLSLIVEDDGVGMPPALPALDAAGAATLGHQLVLTLARQLGATVSVDRTGGTRFAITFHRGAAQDAM
jgi:two-component sensor histidine kinase